MMHTRQIPHDPSKPTSSHRGQHPRPAMPPAPLATQALLLAGALAVVLAGCKGGSGDNAAAPAPTQAMEPMAPPPAEEYAASSDNEAADKAAAPKPELDDSNMAKEESSRKKSAPGRGGKGGVLGGAADQAEDAPAMRAWFPETFLFEPLVITDDSGAASVEVRVPDRLTTWRILGLAHSRTGAQAGAVATFLGTLPAYVDPVVPPQLRAGDVVRLPIQLVNTSDAPLASELAVTVANAELTGGASGPVTLPARGSLVRYATVRAEHAGELGLRARLGATDAVTRIIEVVSTAMPVTQERRGTLAEARRFELTVPASMPGETERVRLAVLPGALAIVRTELAASVNRSGAAEDAFALLIAGTAKELLAAFGDAANEDAVRTLAMVGTQRAVRHGRVMDVATATLLADAARVHPDNPVLMRLGERAVAYLAAEQRPDGTCGGDSGWTLQRMLVATAECARAAASKPELVIRASGVFERHAELIKDPYTAAAALASGVVTDQRSERLAAKLREVIRAAIYQTADGAKAIKIPADVVRADGMRPSEVEATALAVLALRGDASAPLADLGATVMAGYSPVDGWGDGRASLVGIRAVLELFRDPLPESVGIVVSKDGVEVTRGALERERLREMLVLEAGTEARGTHVWEVRAEPPVPGLGFALSVTSMVAWPAPRADSGVELAVSVPAGAAVGRPAVMNVVGKVPSGRDVRVRLELPAGVQVDPASLDQQVSQGKLRRYELADGVIELYAGPLAPAQVLQAAIRVIPTLAGTVHSGAHRLTVRGDGGAETYVPPAPWVIK